MRVRRAPPPVSSPVSQDSKATNDLAGMLLDNLSTSLKSMKHSFWSPCRTWIHRINFVCYFAHLVAVNIMSISMDVVQEEEKDTPLVSIKHGSVYVNAKYDSKSAKLECSVRFFQYAAIRCVAPTVDGLLEIGSTELTIAVPVSRDSNDERAPIPTSCSVSCDFINVEIGFLHLLKLASSEMAQSCSKTDSGCITQSRSMEPNCSMVLLRLIEAVPDVISFVLHRLEVKLTNSMDLAVSQTGCALRLGKTCVRLIGSVHHQNRQGDEFEDQSLTNERKLTAELGPLSIRLQDDDIQECPSSDLLRMDLLRCDVDMKLAAYAVSGSADEDGDSDADTLAILSCNSRVSGEAKGLSIAITPDLRPWVVCIQTALEHQQPIKYIDTPTHASEECSSSESQHPSIFDTIEMEMEVQFKVQQTEILFIPLEKECVVLASGVPGLQIVAEEISIFAHPFIGDESLGVRSKADIQSSRLKVFSLNEKMSKTCFISLDFTRVFVDPVSLMNANQSPAEVEMEAEWLEVKWTSDAIHSIAGMLELSIYIASPFLKKHSSNVEASDDGWDIDARNRVPNLKSIDEVVADRLCGSERAKFRCTIKRTLVLFAYNFDEQKHIEYVTVDSLTMSVEETTGRFRISISQTKLYHIESDDERSFMSPTFGNQRPPRRTSSVFSSKRAGSARATSPSRMRACYSSSPMGNSSQESAKPSEAYLSIQTFALEENNIPNCSKKVIDIFADNVRYDWDLPGQIRVMELVRRVTFSVWEMLYRVRSTYATYCTPHNSLYNRPWGINPPLTDATESERCAKLLKKLISASGDGLHRIHATNIVVDAKMTREVHLEMEIGIFGGNDLPDLWDFRDISLRFNSHNLLAVDLVHVQHTIDKRRDYVFGEFEEMLRLRMAACGQVGDHDKSRCDGMLIDIEGLRIQLRTDIPFLDHLEDIQHAFAPYLESLTSGMGLFWRPQHEIFYQYFLRVPTTPGQTKVWLTLDNLVVECSDNPLESWLERIYPLWLEELQEQDLRAQILEEQVTTLKLTNADLLCEDAHQEMKTLLVEKNAKIYFQKVKKLQTKYRQHPREDWSSGSLFCTRIGHLSTDIAFEGDAKKTIKRLQSLDEASDSIAKIFTRSGRTYSTYTPAFELLEGIQLDVSLADLTVQMRNFSTPLLVCDRLGLTGHVIIAVCSTAGVIADSEKFNFAARLRCFAELSLEVVHPIMYFSPSYLNTLDEIACLAQRFLPLMLLDVDKHHNTSSWDILRRLFHGKVSIALQDAAIRLLCSSTSFDVAEYLEVSIQRLGLDYSTGKIDFNIYRLTAKIDPGSLSNIAEFSNIRIEVWLKWASKGDSSLHYGFPVQYQANKAWGIRENGDTVMLDSCTSRILRVDDSRHDQFSVSQSLKMYQASGLSVFIRGKMCPTSSDIGIPATKGSWLKRDIATRTAIVLYTKHVEWLIRFARLYLTLPRYPFPRRGRKLTVTTAATPTTSFTSICDGITIEEFTIAGLDLALYHTEKHPVGIRAFVNENIVMSGAILTSTHMIFQAPSAQAAKKTKIRRLHVPVDNQIWIVHDVTVSVQDIQVRICTPQSGSRGESLVSVKAMALKVGGGSERIPTHDDTSVMIPSLSTTKVSDERAESFSGGGGDTTEGSRGRTKKNILEHFSIQQHNPYCFRDSDNDASIDADIIEQEVGQNFQAEFVDEFRRLGFLMGLSAREARILVTLGAVETLIDLVESWMRVITVCLPELLGPLNEPLPPNDPIETDECAHAEAGSSPKKITSLAEDPKFGAIFYQSIAREKSSGSFSNIPSSTFSDEMNSMPRAESSGTVLQVHANDPSQTALPGANIVESFFMVKFADCQISVQDHLHKGSVLLALNCGNLKDSISSDSSHEFIDLKVDGLQLFTAPLDIDVKSRIIWLKALSDGSYCPSSYGLLRQVIAPIPAKAAIWVDRDVAISHKIDLQIPTIQVGLNVISKDILQNLALAMTTLITTKLAEKTAPDYSKMLQANHLADANSRSIHNLRALKKQLKWRIAHLHWRQMCRWNYYISERANVAFAAAENNRNLSFEVETSPFFRQRKTSAASISSMTTDMSISGSGVMNCDTDHFTDDLQRLTQQYESICEVLRGVIKSEQKKKQPLPNVDLDFHLQSASLTLSGTNMDIARVSMSSLRFKMKQFEDQSGSFTLTLQDLSTHNLCPGTKYPDLLQPSSTSNTWGGGNAFLRVDAEIAAPVGGITVVKHFEVNVHPLQVCITQEIILQLVAFFSSSAASNSTLDEKRDEIRSKFLQARPASSSGDGLLGSALKKAVKVAGNAAHPLGLSRHKDEADHTSSSSARTRSMSLIHEEASVWISRAITNTNEPNETQLLLRGDEDALHTGEPTHDPSAEREISEMKDRAKTNILFKRIRIGTIEVVVTYKNKKSNHHHNQQTLEDMRGFEVKIHALVYCDKTCSMMDLMLRIRRDVILDILSQVGRNFTNIGNFLRDQFDITRWAPFDALAPLKTLSTTVTSIATVSSISPAPSSMAASGSANEVSPRKRAATAPTATHAQDTAQKFQLELPETHRALRKKHTTSNPRPAEPAHRRLPAAASSSSPATSPRQNEQGQDQGVESLDSDHLPHHHHRSTAGKAKKALVHLFSKKKSGSALTSPSSPSTSHQEQQSPIASAYTPDAAQ